MPRRYQEGDAGSHGQGTSYRTCLSGIWMWLQDLTGKEQQIEHGLETTDRTCLLGIKRGLQVFTGSKHQIERAY